GVEPQTVVRDLALIGSRFYVADNTIEECHCHAMLVQLPNGLIERNVMRNLTANALRLLTDVGSWNEGVGAINVIVRQNTIINSGIDGARMVPWAAISVY